jgi:hypothetical protein
MSLFMPYRGRKEAEFFTAEGLLRAVCRGTRP